MLTEQQLTSVLVTERRIYTALSEVLELTGELSASTQRGDSVFVQLFLQLRQESINQSRGYQINLAQQCRILPAEDRKELEGLLSGRAPAVSSAAHPLQEQLQRDRVLWTRVVQANRVANGCLCGKDSLYDSQPRSSFTDAWGPAIVARPSRGWMRVCPK